MAANASLQLRAKVLNASGLGGNEGWDFEW